MRAIILVVAATLTLCACSSPYIYQKEIGSFSSSISAVSDAVTQGLGNVAQDQAAADLAQVVSARAGVDLDPECGKENTSSPCRVLAHGKTADSDLANKLAELTPATRKVVAALKAYADGLAAITNAQDRKDYDAAASQLASGVAGLGTAVGAVTPAGAAAGPALSAAVTFETWVIGQSFDEARYKTLRSAINAVGMPSKELNGQSPIQVVVDNGITPALSVVRSARITLLYRELNARQDRVNFDLAAAGPVAISSERYDIPLRDLASLVATLNLVRAVDPATVGKSLVSAHDDLMKAVNDKSRQFQSLVSSIADFADKTAALEKAFTKPAAPTTK